MPQKAHNEDVNTTTSTYHWYYEQQKVQISTLHIREKHRAKRELCYFSMALTTTAQLSVQYIRKHSVITE